jgi:O6-methylguanine-DNA--protein-cysteine methyltransferase
VAGTPIHEIYCHKTTFGELTVYVASSKKVAVRIGLGLRDESDSISFFRDLFPGTRLIESRRRNLDLLMNVDATIRNRPFGADLKYDLSCTPFQWRVYETIARIPFGGTMTYGEVARLVDRPGGARAIGQAMGSNPLPILFP